MREPLSSAYGVDVAVVCGVVFDVTGVNVDVAFEVDVVTFEVIVVVILVDVVSLLRVDDGLLAGTEAMLVDPCCCEVAVCAFVAFAFGGGVSTTATATWEPLIAPLLLGVYTSTVVTAMTVTRPRPKRNMRAARAQDSR